ncbi:MAG: tyrosine--tRNA ligase [Verrucomicrobia bacterium]|nr:tyrosine--tRNA ligase [Verrucomicrobiota bacterium]
MNILDELNWRGLVADCTDTAELARRTSLGTPLTCPADTLSPSDGERDGVRGGGPITVYCGFDPTADSLHVGNLVPLLALRRFQLLGHHPIALAGGATGSIGDPSGKTQERQLLTKEILDHNIASVRQQLAKLLDFDTKQNPAHLVDNASWTANVSYLEFLRDIGKHFSVNQMVAKESVRARMEDREVGISYTEFSYMLLQAFDFYVLARDQNCELQIGGSDQWGNITAGIDLCRKKLGKTVFGLTLPLITNADGSKFGKTAAGAIWLDPKRTSVYRFYQFWINTDDRDVLRYLKFFTFLSRDEITALEKKHAENSGAREAHKALAKAATDLIHGANATTEALRASEILFGGNLDGVSETTFNEIVGEVPTKEIEKAKLDGAGLPLVELLVHAGLCPSKGQARKDIEGGGVNINNVREASATRAVTTSDLLFGKHALLRKGKKNYVVVTAK